MAGLKERKQQEEALNAERSAIRDAASRRLAKWTDQHRGDVYKMMRTCHLFADIFGNDDPMASVTLPKGDPTALKKAWHKLAAKLHPDKQRNASTATQVLAEEVFKTLTLAYNKELEKLALRA